MKNYLTLFILVILLNLTFAAAAAKSKPYYVLLNHTAADETVTIDVFKQAIKSLDSDFTAKKEEPNQLRQNFAKVINEYAKALFYGTLNGGKPEIQKAYYFFKLAAEYGSSETLYYLSFYSYYNLDGRFLLKNNYKNLENSDSHGYLKYYIEKMNATNLIANTYISSLQGYNASTSIMGNLYFHGRGTERECPSSALYFKQLAELLFVKDELNEYKSPELLERRKLDEIYFHNEADLESTQVAEDALEYISRNAQLGLAPYLVELGHIYYFGLRGEKRDLRKAFDYYFKAANAGDSDSKIMVGKMLIEGIGVSKDVRYGMDFLTTAEYKKDPVALNILGKLYYYGEGVDRDEDKAISYFKAAAEKNVTDAMYNYASALLQKDKDRASRARAYQLIEVAAKSGHALSMFHLGLSYLEGTDIFYNCELGAGFLKTVAQRGPWNRKLRNGYTQYKKKNRKLAALYYMEAALIGYDLAHSNAGLIIDKYNVFDEHDLDVQGVKQEVTKDPLWRQLETTNNYKPPKDLDELLYQDILEILSTLKYDENKKTEILKSLTHSSQTLAESYNHFITFELFRNGAEEDDELSLLKLGDLYQEGKVVPQSYTKAYAYYESLFAPGIYSFITNSEITAMAMYNMAYMTHNGLGKEKNLTLAIIQYENCQKLSLKSANYMLYVNKKLAEWEKFYFDRYLNATGKAKDEKESMNVKDIIKYQMTYFEEKYSKPLFMGFFIVAALVLFLVKLRLENYMDIYLKDQRRPKTD